LALIAAIPASLTLALRVTRPAAPPRAHVRQAAAMAVIFYGVMPWFVLGGSLGAVATLLPVALAWHLVLAAAPVAPDAGPSRPGDLTAD
ncbi:MAG: hypothetical protein KC464_14015, partial [Myxococcales bacterium]|nr:hypothetical protein [Myxococcales bacterium]